MYPKTVNDNNNKPKLQEMSPFQALLLALINLPYLGYFLSQVINAFFNENEKRQLKGIEVGRQMQFLANW